MNQSTNQQQSDPASWKAEGFKGPLGEDVEQAIWTLRREVTYLHWLVQDFRESQLLLRVQLADLRVQFNELKERTLPTH
jgi:hypothetical protein